MSVTIEDLLTPKEAAAYLGMQETTLKKYRHLNKGPDYIKLGRHVYYSKEALRQWAKSNLT